MNEYNAGEIWEAVKGETVTRGRLTRLGDYLWVGDSGRTPENLESYGFTLSIVEKAAAVVVLPTEPGAYKDVDRHSVIVLNHTGQWLNEDGAHLTMAPGTKLTRLEPVSETAKKVLDRVFGMTLGGASVLAATERLRAEFGVTS